jgi:ribosomal protein S18 acetylase RimI-like enzyme
MKKFDYIVAFYLQDRRSSHYKKGTKDNPFVLVERHLHFLYNNKIPNLNKIYFVFNVNNLNKFDKTVITDITNQYSLNVNLIFRENKGLSYGAWNHALKYIIKNNPLSEYAFLCEDDYIPTIPEFSLPFLQQFENNQKVGYVAELIAKLGNKKHAAISNGFISYEVSKILYNKHKQIFDIMDLTPEEKPIYHIGVNNQLQFLNFIEENKYQILDISKTHCLPFFELRIESIEFYGNTKGPIIIEPILSSIILTPLTKNDLPFLLEVRNDPSTRKFLGNDSVFSLKECEKWFKNLKAEWFIIKDLGTKVGYMRTTPDGEVGLDIHPDHRRKGYARKAYNEYLKYKQFATLWVFEDNFAKNLYIELGFKPTGNTGEIRGRDYTQMFYYNPDFIKTHGEIE